MSSCLSGGSRVYGLEIEVVKSLSSSTITSHLSSPSSTLSESSNSPHRISTRKPRTPRKRPNQTYNEAATLLSTANPRIFSPKHLLAKPCKFTTPHDRGFLCESAELLLPFRVFDNSGFLLRHPIQEKPSFRIEPSVVYSGEKSCQSPVENDFPGDLDEDFDTESILDEEIEKGIDSIMGNLSAENNDSVDDKANVERHSGQVNTCYHGFPMGLGFWVRKGVRALRHVDEGEWWRFPTVDVLQISPKLGKSPPPADKKKKKVEKAGEVVKIIPESPKKNSITKQQKENSIPKSSHGLLLKLNYDGIANAWSDRGSPFSEGTPGHEMSSRNNDLHARLAQIDLFSESGGVRDASVLRYKEKRRSRLFSKKIRYEVRKVNADRRPRMKGRFVRRPNSPMSEE